MAGLGAAVALGVAITIALSPLLLLAAGVRWRASRAGKAALTLGAALSLAGAGLAWHALWPGSAILAQGTSPEGRDYCLVQAYQSPTEPYRVALYVRDPAGVWWAHTVDPDGASWRGATVEARGAGRLAACRGATCRELAVPEETVDLESVLPGYRLHYAPARYTCGEVLAQHRR